MNSTIHHLHDEHPRHTTPWLLIGISGVCGLGWLINTQYPTHPIFLLLFFGILFIAVYGITFFITHTQRRALLISIGVLLFFLLRFFGLRDWFYPVLLTACLISLEILFQKR